MKRFLHIGLMFAPALLSPHSFFLTSALAVPDGDECVPEWIPTFGPLPGTHSAPTSLAWFDDGSGMALWAAVHWSLFNDTPGLMAFDGEQWNDRSNGLGEGDTHVVAVLDLGDGPALYSANEAPPYVAKWNGSAWEEVGVGIGPTPFYEPRPTALTTYDSGNGRRLVVVGSFKVGNSGAKDVAELIDGVWKPIGGHVTASFCCLESAVAFDDGAGEALYVAGSLSTLEPDCVAVKWNGSEWSKVGDNVIGDFESLHVFDDGSGAALYAGGTFVFSEDLSVGGVAKWDGTQWTPVGGSSTNAQVSALSSYVSPDGPVLVAGGLATDFGDIQVKNVAQWNGVNWAPLGGGITAGGATAFAARPDVAGETLAMGGNFQTIAGMPALRVALWNGLAWSPTVKGTVGRGRALLGFTDEAGSHLILGGSFDAVGGTITRNVAQWNGATFATMANGFNNEVLALARYDDGDGPEIFAGGLFTAEPPSNAKYLARWDGTQWHAVGAGVNGMVRALAVFDDGTGSALYVGGDFSSAGGASAKCIARWNGITWSPVGEGLDNDVTTLHVFDDGSGPALYAGGDFTKSGNTTVKHVARWNGVAWSPVGAGMNNDVDAFATFDDGRGPRLFAGGFFTDAGVPADRIAVWNGVSWESTGVDFTGSVTALCSVGEGPHAALYAGGSMTSVDGLACERLVRWDGTEWSPADTEFDDTVWALMHFDPGDGDSLFAAGWFKHSTAGDAGFARFKVCVDECAPGDANCDGLVDGADIAALLGAWGPCNGCAEDLNDDGVVDGADITFLLGEWG